MLTWFLVDHGNGSAYLFYYRLCVCVFVCVTVVHEGSN